MGYYLDDLPHCVSVLSDLSFLLDSIRKLLRVFPLGRDVKTTIKINANAVFETSKKRSCADALRHSGVLELPWTQVI